MEDPFARCGRGVLDDESAALSVDAQRHVLPAPAIGLLELDLPARRQLPVGPVDDVEAAAAEGVDHDLEAGHERVEQQGYVDGPAATRLSEGGHRARELGRERVRGPVGVDADPDDGTRVGTSEAVCLAQNAT